MQFWSIIFIVLITGANALQVNEKQIVSVSVDKTIAVRGTKSVVNIKVKVKDGYHIQANKVNDKSLIPATLEVPDNKIFAIGKAIFPRYKLFRLEGVENDLNVFDSVFIIHLPVSTPVSSKEGQYIIKAEFHYQACNESICLFPRTLSFDLCIIVK